MCSLFTLFNQCSDPVIPREHAHELQVHLHSCILFRWTLSVLIISLSSFQMFFMSVHLLIVHLSLFLSGVLKISQKNHVSILNPFEYFDIFLSFKLFNSTDAISISSKPSMMFLSSGPNPQVFSQDLT